MKSRRISQAFILALTLILVFSLAGIAQAAAPQVVFDGQQLSFDVPPVVEDGRTLVPFRAIFEAFEADVDWNAETNSVIASKGSTNIELPIGKNIAYLNGQKIQLDAFTKAVRGRTLVPLRFIGESLNANVDWDGATNTVIITTGEKTGKPLTAHFIDVGQGDSILVQLPNGQALLIDAGPNEAGSTVVNYLQDQGIKKIDYLVATHPHADHIGGMDNVIQAFEIGKVYMPRVTTTTKTFEDVLLAVQAKGLKITPAKAGLTILGQGNLKVSFVAPCGNGYDNLNDWSAVVKVEHGNTSFLLTGDAETLAEQEMLASSVNLKADVLKVGHHGSKSSTSPAFLKTVSPKYGVVSVGAGNSYGHPHQTVLDKLATAGVQVFRTDQHGTIIFVSDGKTLTVRALRNTIVPRAPDHKIALPTPVSPVQTIKYIGNKNTKKFHKPSCSSLPAPKNRIHFNTREEAVKTGYVPCKRCNP